MTVKLLEMLNVFNTLNLLHKKTWFTSSIYAVQFLTVKYQLLNFKALINHRCKEIV
jgi:hypothetical protein